MLVSRTSSWWCRVETLYTGYESVVIRALHRIVCQISRTFCLIRFEAHISWSWKFVYWERLKKIFPAAGAIKFNNSSSIRAFKNSRWIFIKVEFHNIWRSTSGYTNPSSTSHYSSPATNTKTTFPDSKKNYSTILQRLQKFLYRSRQCKDYASFHLRLRTDFRNNLLSSAASLLFRYIRWRWQKYYENSPATITIIPWEICNSSSIFCCCSSISS